MQHAKVLKQCVVNLILISLHTVKDLDLFAKQASRNTCFWPNVLMIQHSQQLFKLIVKHYFSSDCIFEYSFKYLCKYIKYIIGPDITRKVCSYHCDANI